MLDHIIHYRSFYNLNYNNLVYKFLITKKVISQKSILINQSMSLTKGCPKVNQPPLYC